MYQKKSYTTTRPQTEQMKRESNSNRYNEQSSQAQSNVNNNNNGNDDYDYYANEYSYDGYNKGQYRQQTQKRNQYNNNNRYYKNNNSGGYDKYDNRSGDYGDYYSYSKKKNYYSGKNYSQNRNADYKPRPQEIEESKENTKSMGNNNQEKEKEKEKQVISDEAEKQQDYISDEEGNGTIQDANVPLSELTELLTKRFNNRTAECPICFNKIKSEAKIWSCKQCYGPYHLGCIIKWLSKNPANEKKEGKLQETFIWTCPKCCYCYSEGQPEYFCFCGKARNPEYDPYNIPHSCGDVCGKMRGASCIHPCNMNCHPGPCPPCNLMGKTKSCFCGKTTYQTKCSDDRDAVSCGKKCEKILDCGLHKCQQTCHKGRCSSCSITEEVSCHCGKETKIVGCGKSNFSCNKPCGKTLDCGNHPCKMTCHEGSCKECPYTPSKLKTCGCGKMSLTLLGVTNRKSCLDPIPSCGLPCPKKCPNGHPCKKSCHGFECPSCNIMMEQVCRCGKNNREIECGKATGGTEEEKRYICDKICQKKKSCGVHKCLQKCCDATKSYDDNANHLCLKICGKPLNCSKHTCELFCHLGDCKPCPIIINRPITCACGNTIKNPPLPCGTSPPTCALPCKRERPCGHPCLLDCHMDECPPCEELVEKICNCGKNTIKNVKCSKEVLCGKQCEKVLACGHKCGEICHKDGCKEERGIVGCGKKCGKKREFCDHRCVALCHPGKPCPIDKCKVEVKVTCECGNRESWTECGATDKKEIKVLKCDKSCANLKRFGSFFQKETNKKSYYPPHLVRFAKNELNFLVKLEEKIEKMLKDGKDQLDIPLGDVNSIKKNNIQALLSKHYGLNLEFYLNVKNPIVCVRTTTKTMIPKIKLSEYLRQIETKQIKPEILPFEATLKLFNISAYDSLEELEIILKDFDGACYIERSNEKTIYVHFWTKSAAQEAMKVLKKSHSNFMNVTLEENTMLKLEEEKAKINEEEIITEVIKGTEEVKVEEENKSALFFIGLNKS